MAEQKQDKKQKQGGKPQGGPGGAKKEKKPKGQAAEAQQEAPGGDEPQAPAPPARLVAVYKERVLPTLQKELGFTNALAAPRLEKIVISMGLGKAIKSEEGKGKEKMNQAERELTVIAGQKPVRCKAKKSVANFKVREGEETGLKVTLRGTRMYEFLDRLITLAFPRVKDFRGLNPNGFDEDGNYNFGFTEQTVFPEVDTAAVTFQQGMNITMVTTAKKPEHGRELLKQFGFPFRTDEKEGRDRR